MIEAVPSFKAVTTPLSSTLTTPDSSTSKVTVRFSGVVVGTIVNVSSTFKSKVALLTLTLAGIKDTFTVISLDKAV